METYIEELSSKYEGPELFAAIDQGETGFFLDSGLSQRDIGRYSFIGFDPFLLFSAKGNVCHIKGAGKQEEVIKASSPMVELAKIINHYSTNQNTPFPMAHGGAVGYFSYDLGRLFERLPSLAADDLTLPECYFAFYDCGIVIDRQNNSTFLFSTGNPFSGEKRKIAAHNKLKLLREKIKTAKKSRLLLEKKLGAIKLQSNFSRDSYYQAVEKVLEYIILGDIYQVNLSQRFSFTLQIDAWELYGRLRQINPAPFAAFLRFPEVTIASSSPERFLLVDGCNVETRPIKGTRPRGKDATEDELLKKELLSSEKDRAELLMIVDLERNDLGRVCETGTIKVPDLFSLETYPTVHHLVATVRGTMPRGKSVTDLIPSIFPGGSITGAPKIRAMEIIEELEPVRRSIYTGSLGYIDFTGKSDLNIVIRTFIIKGNKGYFQVGGGIVADSKPHTEYLETLDKARALFHALGIKEGEY